jgi:hypothetical protein
MRLRPAVIATALLCVVTGCGDDGADTRGGGSPTTATDPGTSDPSGPPGPAGVRTPAPGTDLAYGDTATVELDTHDDVPAYAEWTVTGVEPGTPTGGPLTPYRIRVTLTALTDLYATSLLPDVEFEGIDSTGHGTVADVEAGCDNEVRPTDLEAGDSVELCVPVVTVEDRELVGVRYARTAAYNARTFEPVVWKS